MPEQARETIVPRRGLSEIPAYVPGKAPAGDAAPVAKLSSNECALGASPAAVAAYRSAAGAIFGYPDAAGALTEALAAAHAALEDAAVLVRPLPEYALPDALRISIRTDPENERLLEALGTFMRGQGPA